MAQDMRDFYYFLLETAENTEIKVLSDDFCCKLLAWVYCYGGGCEATVHNVKMNAHIRLAQKRLNIEGGEVPNVKLLPVLQSYIKQISPQKTIKDGKMVLQDVKHPDWAYEICDMYAISHKHVS